jgi:Xaa-Pro aminopeptidase
MSAATHDAGMGSVPSGMRFFSDEEFESRLERVRDRIAAQKLDGVIITNPENIYYLTGLNHQGYTGCEFVTNAPRHLIVR